MSAAPPAAEPVAGSPHERTNSKHVFVTVGASASFKPLIEEVISDAFVAKLESLSFTHLTVQCGPDHEFFQAAVAARPPGGLNITGFAFKNDLFHDMQQAAPYENNEVARHPGLIITHAGSGSILDALDTNSNLIAVPNTSLMDNHQSEIAEEMERQGFLVQGKIGSLIEAIDIAAQQNAKPHWPPAADPNATWPGGLWDVIHSLLPPNQHGGPGAAVQDGLGLHAA
ncbi:glycosyltransferase family 1 protein [Hypoxylon sp. FL1150]|nr:glycosyltransferase family 1 protein [Hypoxylon sp. FL1150]